MENEVEEQRSKEELVESIQYNKRVIRGLEIIFIVMAIGVLGFFVKMIAYGSTALDLISYTALLIACWKVWDTGQDYEVGKFWDEIELMQIVNKEEYEKNDEEVS